MKGSSHPVLTLSCLVAAVLLLTLGAIRLAVAADADCVRVFTRVWDSELGDWVYTDGGCPPGVQCDPNHGVCDELELDGWAECSCQTSWLPPCILRVRKGWDGPKPPEMPLSDIARCSNTPFCPILQGDKCMTGFTEGGVMYCECL